MGEANFYYFTCLKSIYVHFYMTNLYGCVFKDLSPVM